MQPSGFSRSSAAASSNPFHQTTAQQRASNSIGQSLASSGSSAFGFSASRSPPNASYASANSNAMFPQHPSRLLDSSSNLAAAHHHHHHHQQQQQQHAIFDYSSEFPTLGARASQFEAISSRSSASAIQHSMQNSHIDRFSSNASSSSVSGMVNSVSQRQQQQHQQPGQIHSHFNKTPYVGIMKQPVVDNTPKFQMTQEEFPALPGAPPNPSRSSPVSLSSTPATAASSTSFSSTTFSAAASTSGTNTSSTTQSATAGAPAANYRAFLQQQTLPSSISSGVPNANTTPDIGRASESSDQVSGLGFSSSYASTAAHTSSANASLKDSATGSSTTTHGSTASGGNTIPNRQGTNSTSRPDFQLDPHHIRLQENGMLSNIPGAMVSDQYGMSGFVVYLKTFSCEPNLLYTTLGTDLGNLGVPAQNCQVYPRRNGMFYPFFANPCDNAFSPFTLDQRVPPEYLYAYKAIEQKQMPLSLKDYSEEMLFTMFYGHPQDILQVVAAIELYNRDWRWHKDMKIWIAKLQNHTPIEKTSNYERGSFLVFDANTWKKGVKELLVEYRSLDEKPHLNKDVAIFLSPLHRKMLGVPDSIITSQQSQQAVAAAAAAAADQQPTAQRVTSMSNLSSAMSNLNTSDGAKEGIIGNGRLGASGTSGSAGSANLIPSAASSASLSNIGANLGGVDASRHERPSAVSPLSSYNI